MLLKAGLGQPLEQPMPGSADEGSAESDFLLAGRLPDQHPARGIEPAEHGAEATRQATASAPLHPGGKCREA